MKKVRYSSLLLGEKFKVDNIEYIRYNHNRGKTKVNGQQVFKRFKKHALVEVE
jgi:hypothetical protein